MNIQKFATKPQLVQVQLDDPELLETYGEPITFHTYDVVNMKIYFDFFNARAKGEVEALEKLMKQLILNEKGEPVLSEGKDLPIDITTAAIIKLGDILGKSPSKKSTPKIGKQPKSSQ